MRYKFNVTEWRAIYVEYVIEADSLEEAIEKAENGHIVSKSCDSDVDYEIMNRLVDPFPIQESAT